MFVETPNQVSHSPARTAGPSHHPFRFADRSGRAETLRSRQETYLFGATSAFPWVPLEKPARRRPPPPCLCPGAASGFLSRMPGSQIIIRSLREAQYGQGLRRCIYLQSAGRRTQLMRGKAESCSWLHTRAHTAEVCYPGPASCLHRASPLTPAFCLLFPASRYGTGLRGAE